MADTPAIWKAQHQVNLTDLDNQEVPAVISIGNGRDPAWRGLKKTAAPSRPPLETTSSVRSSMPSAIR